MDHTILVNRPDNQKLLAKIQELNSTIIYLKEQLAFRAFKNEELKKKLNKLETPCTSFKINNFTFN